MCLAGMHGSIYSILDFSIYAAMQHTVRVVIFFHTKIVFFGEQTNLFNKIF